jgi:hypothetical protein
MKPVLQISRWLVPGLLLLLGVGCGDESGTKRSSCIVNSTIPCQCPDTSVSYQICVDGITYSPCQCAGGMAGIGGAPPVGTGGTGTGGTGTGGTGTGGTGTGGTGTGGTGTGGNGGSVEALPGTAATGGIQDGIPIADFTGTDINPNSPTVNQVRNLGDNRGKVMAIYYADWWGGESAAQFAQLDIIVRNRHANGFSPNDLEAWSVANYGDSYFIGAFSAGVSSPCYEDDTYNTIRSALGLGKLSEGVVVILNRDLLKVCEFNVTLNPITEDVNRTQLDALIGEVL